MGADKMKKKQSDRGSYSRNAVKITIARKEDEALIRNNAEEIIQILNKQDVKFPIHLCAMLGDIFTQMGVDWGSIQ
jgi:hypothetical protein